MTVAIVLFSLCYRERSEGEHYQVYQAAGGPTAQVRAFAAVSLFSLELTRQLNIPKE